MSARFSHENAAPDEGGEGAAGEVAGARTTPWVQLTYVSMERPGSARGGWGVAEITPDAPADLVEVLRNGVVTSIEEVTPTSPFATQAELAARPRRLLCTEAPDGTTLMWHATSAGQDATGRPGNVFTHAAATRSPSPDTRPIDYWRSHSWLTPFGIGEVDAAKVTTLRPGDTIGRGPVVDFIYEGDNRFAAEWLLAAVAYAYASGSTVVLAAETADEAAQWIGVVCHLMSPAQARGLRWVTFERASNVSRVVAVDSLDLVCIPREDLDEMLTEASPTTLALDPRWSLDDDGTLWEAPGGQSWPDAPRWQNAMLDLFSLDKASILEVLATMDDITSSLTSAAAAGLPPHWGLSMAMLVTGSPVTDAEQVRRECVDTFPPELDQHPALAEFVPRRRAAEQVVEAVPEPAARPRAEHPERRSAGYASEPGMARGSEQTQDAGPPVPRQTDLGPPAKVGPWPAAPPRTLPPPSDETEGGAATGPVAPLPIDEPATGYQQPRPGVAPLASAPISPWGHPTGASGVKQSPIAARRVSKRTDAGLSLPPELALDGPQRARLVMRAEDVVKKRDETAKLLWHYNAMECVLTDMMDVADYLAPTILDSIGADTEGWVRVVMGLVLGSDRLLAADLVVTALNRDVVPLPGRSVLSHPVDGGLTLGWTAVLAAWGGMGPEEQDAIYLAKFTSYRGMPSPWLTRIQQLLDGRI